jgi:EAL domain-containing protein (putative c-di-GMP-specific phosphodiesterase class I)
MQDDRTGSAWSLVTTLRTPAPTTDLHEPVGATSASEFVRLHPHEHDRLDSLASYGVLDTPPETTYDALTALAARLCGTPIAAVTLVDADRQWFKSMHGLGSVETARELSFCSDVVASGQVLVVPDATASARYRDNALVRGEPRLRSYMGVPLVGRDGLPLGALCVLDRRARSYTPDQVGVLVTLAEQVVFLLEQHRRDLLDGVLSEDVLQEARDPVRLRAALHAGELVPHYQPLVDITTGRPHQIEALLRWEHPRLGTLPPSAFLPAIEASALVVPVGRAVLDAALGQLADLSARGHELPGGVAVNVASGQLARPGLARDVLASLDRHGLLGSSLTVEITEATALGDPALAAAELDAVVAMGVSVVIDDFGVGWSNLTRILQLPVDALKIDRGVAAGAVEDPRAAAMVASTVQLAHSLGLDVTAEGIETEQVRDHLAAAGVRWAQGWLYSPAVPAAELSGVLDRLSAR